MRESERRRSAPDPRTGSRLARWRHTLKQICGMPDYERYLDEARARGDRVLTEREYYDRYLASRYGGGGSRCC